MAQRTEFMKLYFLRHAHAEDGTGHNDHERKLTDRGVRDARAAAHVLAALGVEPAHIYASPRVRARQTAEIVAAQLDLAIEIREEVNFGFNVATLRQLLDRSSEYADLMFVGHEPTFSATIAELSGARIQMKKCGFARVDLVSQVPLRGELIWLLSPRIYKALDNS